MNAVTINQRPPTGYRPQSTDAAFNNQYAMALASADPRFAIKQYDRGGISRGGAQFNQAGIDAAQKFASGLADAYGNQYQNVAYNANTALQGQQSQEQFGQALGGLQQQNNYANQMAALQRQQAVMGTLTSLLGGLLG